MKTNADIVNLLAAGTREAERTLGIKLRNGQAAEAYRKALAWVLT